MHVYMYIYIYDLSKLAREEKVLLFIGGSSPNLPLCRLKKKKDIIRGCCAVFGFSSFRVTICAHD